MLRDTVPPQISLEGFEYKVTAKESILIKVRLYNMRLANVSLITFLLYNSDLMIIKSPDNKGTD